MTTRPSIESLREILTITDLYLCDKYQEPLSSAISELADYRTREPELIARAEKAEEDYKAALMAGRLACEIRDDIRAERDSLRTQLATEREAREAERDALAAHCEALREALDVLHNVPGVEDHHCIDHRESGRCCVCAALRTLSTTPAASLEAHDARVRREVLEGAAKRALVMLSQSWDPAWGYSDALPGDIQAAILGPAPQPNTANTAPREEE